MTGYSISPIVEANFAFLESILRTKPLIAASLAVFAAAAFAQVSLGTVSNVQGLVTFTVDGQTGGTVNTSTQIANNMRFVTPTGGGMTLQMNNGCSVSLLPNQAVTVKEQMTCQQLADAVQTLGTGVANAGGTGVSGAGGGGGGLGALGIVGLGATYAIGNKTLINQSLSSN